MSQRVKSSGARFERLDGEKAIISEGTLCDGGGMIFMAVSMRWAITHPTIFSLSLVAFADDKALDASRSKYAFESASISAGRSGAERARFTVCITVAS